MKIKVESADSGIPLNKMDNDTLYIVTGPHDSESVGDIVIRVQKTLVQISPDGEIYTDNNQELQLMTFKGKITIEN
jgi:hypothetical protein